jgi:hypothetical protein
MKLSTLLIVQQKKSWEKSWETEKKRSKKPNKTKQNQKKTNLPIHYVQ